MSGNSFGDRLHRVHVAERRADDEVEALPGEAPEDLLGVGALRDQLDVRDVRAGEVLAQVLEALVVGLAPAAVVVRADQDHRDVELAGDDVRDLEVRAALAPRPPYSRCRTASAARRRCRAAARADGQCRHREQAREPQPSARPWVPSSSRVDRAHRTRRHDGHARARGDLAGSRHRLVRTEV